MHKLTEDLKESEQRNKTMEAETHYLKQIVELLEARVKEKDNYGHKESSST